MCADSSPSPSQSLPRRCGLSHGTARGALNVKGVASPNIGFACTSGVAASCARSGPCGVASPGPARPGVGPTAAPSGSGAVRLEHGLEEHGGCRAAAAASPGGGAGRASVCVGGAGATGCGCSGLLGPRLGGEPSAPASAAALRGGGARPPISRPMGAGASAGRGGLPACSACCPTVGRGGLPTACCLPARSCPLPGLPAAHGRCWGPSAGSSRGTSLVGAAGGAAAAGDAGRGACRGGDPAASRWPHGGDGDGWRPAAPPGDGWRCLQGVARACCSWNATCTADEGAAGLQRVWRCQAGRYIEGAAGRGKWARLTGMLCHASALVFHLPAAS
jgi:hypothetical protein